jgi:hypothetical protein
MGIHKILGVGAFTVVLVVGASAQTKAADPFDYHASNVRLLMSKAIQTEVGITEAQRAKMNVSADAHEKRIKAWADKMQKAGKRPAQTDPEFLALMETLKKNVLGTLTASQTKRLRELSLQQVGLVAVLDEKVAEKIGVSDAQLKKMRDLYSSGSKEAQALIQKEMKAALASYEGYKPKDDADKKRVEGEAQAKISATEKRIAPQVNKIRTGTRDKMLAQLSQAQKDKFKALQGKPFNGKA